MPGLLGGRHPRPPLAHGSEGGRGRGCLRAPRAPSSSAARRLADEIGKSRESSMSSILLKTLCSTSPHTGFHPRKRVGAAADGCHQGRLGAPRPWVRACQVEAAPAHGPGESLLEGRTGALVRHLLSLKFTRKERPSDTCGGRGSDSSVATTHEQAYSAINGTSGLTCSIQLALV